MHHPFVAGRRPFFRAALIAALALFAGAVSAAVVYVKPDSPGPAHDGKAWATAYTTIQKAVDSSAAGSEIWVARGDYFERVTVAKKLSLYAGFAGNETARDPRNTGLNRSTVDGRQSGNVFVVRAADVVLDGFFIRNGRAQNGGGIYSTGDRLTLYNNNVMFNEAIGDGGGVYSLGVSPRISRNWIAFNMAGTYGNGAGIWCGGSDAEISYNWVNRNTSGGDGVPMGGGVYFSASSGKVANNLIVRNHLVSDTAVRGSGLCTFTSNVLVVNNTIAENTYYLYYPQFATPSGSVAVVGSATLVNNVIAFNQSGVSLHKKGTTAGTITMRNNCVFGQAPLFTEMTVPTGVNGNISADPLFINLSDGDYRFQPSSPCVNTGDSSVVTAGTLDMAGYARIQGTKVDMGAFEFTGNAPYYITDVAIALRRAAGLSFVTPEDLARYNVVTTGTSATKIDMPDVLKVMRKAQNKEPNP